MDTFIKQHTDSMRGAKMSAINKRESKIAHIQGLLTSENVLNKRRAIERELAYERDSVKRMKLEIEEDEIEFMLDVIPYIKKCDEQVGVGGVGGASSKRAPNPSGASAISNGNGNGGANGKNMIAKQASREIVDGYMYTECVRLYKCERCGSDKLVDDKVRSDTICTECGVAIKMMDTSSPNVYPFGSRPDTQYCYKRQNHFNEWLSQIQGKERTTIPGSVIESLLLNFKRNRISKVDNIIVRNTLKQLKLNKYYEHVPQITGIVSEKKPPQFTSGQEAKLKSMFHIIQAPFERARVKLKSQRKNFLSYSYVLHKFCQLLQYDEFLSCFPLLKSKDKLYQQDLLWKEICEECGWAFYRTV